MMHKKISRATINVNDVIEFIHQIYLIIDFCSNLRYILINSHA